MKTGKEASNKPIESILTDNTLDNIESYRSGYRKLDNDKTFDDKFVLLGRNYDQFETVGYARMMINKTDFTIDSKWINFSPDLESFLPT
ncbi:hypothetical protein SB679_23755, partial [Chryseobacterium sp. SIMBA_029]